MSKKRYILFLGLLLGLTGYSQEETTKNLPKFDHQFVHFGFLLGYNNADFTLNRFPASNASADSVYIIDTKKTSGFNLGIISAMHLSEYFSLRFTPNLAFAQRGLVYTLQTDEGLREYTKDIESTIINFPLNLKYKSARVNNFSAYLIGGAAFTLDLASNENAENGSPNLNDLIVKIKKYDVVGQLGFGTDFYLEYFKFGIELKMSYGLNNILVPESTVFSDPIEKLRSKMFLLSFTFEG